MYYFIHEAGHAEWDILGKTANARLMNRDAYVAAMIKEESAVQMNAIKAKLALAKDWNTARSQPFDKMTALEQDFADALHVYYREGAQKMGEGPLAKKYAEKMALSHLEDLWQRGEVRSSVGGVHYEYYYGAVWDNQRFGIALPWDTPVQGSIRPAGKVPPPPGGPTVQGSLVKTSTGLMAGTGVAQGHLTQARTVMSSQNIAIPAGALDSAPKLQSLGSSGSVGLGVRPYRLANGDEGVVKLYYSNQARIMESEVASMKAAEKTGFGPKVLGVTTYTTAGGDTHIGIVMEKVPGGFADTITSQTDIAKHKAELLQNAKHINHHTFRDLIAYRNQIFEQGYFYRGDLQGFVALDGHWRPIDLQSAVPIDAIAPRDKYVRNYQHPSVEEAAKAHYKVFDDMFNLLLKNQKLAKQSP